MLSTGSVTVVTSSGKVCAKGHQPCEEVEQVVPRGGRPAADVNDVPLVGLFSDPV